MTFLNRTYYQEKWEKQSFSGEDIQSKVFEDCEFNNCNFTGSSFEKSKLINCKFVECDLSNLELLDCQFTEIQFIKCKVIGINWTKIEKAIKISFSECLLDYSNFRLLKLPGIKMIKCQAKEVDFIETNLSDGDFQETDFEGSLFFKTNLTNADFRSAVNYTIDFTKNTLSGTRFSLPEAMSLLNNSDIIIE